MRQSIEHNNLKWINIQNPQKEDIQFLQDNFNFHEIVLKEIIPASHRPKVENHGDYLFMVLYYPAFNKKKSEAFARELDIIVTKSHLITSHYKTILPLKSLFARINLHNDAKKEYMSEGTAYLFFYLIRSILANVLTKLEHIEHRVDYIEKAIFKGREKEMVFEISETQRDIIDFRRILAPQRSVFASLVADSRVFFGEEFAPHLANLHGNFDNVWNELEEQRETLAALADTNSSLLSTKINEIIKILTIVSTIFMPVTFLANIWGMNIDGMPLRETGSFWIITAVMGLMVILMIGYFKKKKWL